MDELTGREGAEARVEQLPDEQGAPVLKVTGELDISNVGSLRSVVDATFGTSLERIVFDLSELEFMDSSGLAMLLSVAERISTVELRSPRPVIRRVIELTGLSDVFVITG